jgi:hypothetical protein
MDDWSFNIPKKILRALLIGAVILAVIYGVFTGDSKKGAEFYMKEVEFIMTPIINKMQNRMEKIFDRALNQTQDNQNKDTEN